MKRSFYLVLLVVACRLQIHAQLFERSYDIPVSDGDGLLENPWAGGLNSCQVSRIDANMDGKKDIFIFDRVGSRISIYLNMDNTPGVINYKYTMAYNYAFPPGLRNWVLLRDMNCDGLEDICANSGSGFKIYWNTSTTSLSFNQNGGPNVTAFYDWGNSNLTTGVYCISPDLPAFNDYDDDGDIDIWSWNEFSISEFFYKNMAVENGDCTTPDFVCRNRCYGMFGEASDGFQFYTGTDFICDSNVIDPRSAEDQAHLHTGGTTLAVDLDQNGIKDLIIGDVTGNTLASVQMMPSVNGQDSAFVVNYDFPATFVNTDAAEMTTFLAAFYEDINNDGISDLMVSPNAMGDAADRKSLILYINNGLNDLPEFERIQDDFLQDGQIDLGISAYPVFFDVDNDGLKDLIVANRKYFDLGNPYTSIMHYYRNTGTTSAPAFQLIDENWLNIPSHSWASVYPAFGDLDGDDDADLMLGDQEGKVHYYMNDAAANSPANFVLTTTTVVTSDGEDMDPGQNATPQIFDVDNDGKNDLLMGELNGSVNYYHNMGTETNYLFELVEDTIGDAVATSNLGIQGKSVPFMFRNSQGLLELLVGTETGQINYYNNIEGNISGTFNLVTTDFDNLHEGERSAVSLADITGDGQLDLALGNIGGGVGLYTHLPVSVSELYFADQISLFPNPANDRVRIKLPEAISLPVELNVIDGLGKKVFSQKINSRVTDVSTDQLQSGIYLVNVLSDRFTATEKLVIKR